MENFINSSAAHNLRHNIFIKDISKKTVEGLVRGALTIRNLIILEINSVIVSEASFEVLVIVKYSKLELNKSENITAKIWISPESDYSKITCR
jgi:hypothetical protein